LNAPLLQFGQIKRRVIVLLTGGTVSPKSLHLLPAPEATPLKPFWLMPLGWAGGGETYVTTRPKHYDED